MPATAASRFRAGWRIGSRRVRAARCRSPAALGALWRIGLRCMQSSDDPPVANIVTLISSSDPSTPPYARCPPALSMTL